MWVLVSWYAPAHLGCTLCSGPWREESKSFHLTKKKQESKKKVFNFLICTLIQVHHTRRGGGSQGPTLSEPRWRECGGTERGVPVHRSDRTLSLRSLLAAERTKKGGEPLLRLFHQCVIDRSCTSSLYGSTYGLNCPRCHQLYVI